MPYATNPLDGTRIYFEDDGGDGPPVVFHGGILECVETLRMTPLAQAISGDEFRRIFVDHRGLGRSDKPHDPASYAMPLRAADATAVLDVLGIDRAHFIGTSWGGRLCFGIGEHASERVLSLAMGGQQPYAIDPTGPLTRAVGEGILASRSKGIEAFVEALESFSNIRFPEPQRTYYLDNDPAAIEAAWRAALEKGNISHNMSTWPMPCVVFMGAGDVDFHDQAQRAASEIPNAEFISLEAQDHLGAHLEHDRVIPAILQMLRG